MSDAEVKNAIIESAELTTADCGVLSGWVTLDYGGAGQGFGGHVLCVSPNSPHWPGKYNVGGIWVRRVMEAAGVEKWSALQGKSVRVRASRSKVEAIGHIIRDDLWFEPEKEFRAANAERTD